VVVLVELACLTAPTKEMNDAMLATGGGKNVEIIGENLAHLAGCVACSVVDHLEPLFKITH
jgi:hypothetical protein